MKKASKQLTIILIFALILASAWGVFFLQTLVAKLLCGGLGILGLLLATTVYASCRAEMIQIAEELEDTLISAQQGKLPNSGAFLDESVTHRLCLQAVRLAEATQNKAQEQKSSHAKLQSTINHIAHQLRAPMANLTLYADTLASGDFPPQKQAEFLDVLKGQAHKLEFLVEALVKTGRLETGVIRMVPQTTSLRQTLVQSASLAKPLAEEKGLTFIFDCPKDLPILHDPKWTSEAVFNLLDNAIKYTDTGNITLSAKQGEMYTCVEVTDTGIGFDSDESAMLFRRFYRASQVAAIPGVGLGLYIVRQIAQLQGGWVQAKSLEHGSAFRLFLPNS